MRALVLTLLAVPLLAGAPDPLANAVREFESDYPARRDAATRVVRGILQERLGPLLEAMRSSDPEVSRRARECIESFLPTRPEAAPQQADDGPGGPVVFVNGQNQGRVVLRVVQANGQRLRIVNGRWEAEEGYERLKAFGVEGEAALDSTLRRHLRLAEGRGFLVRKVEDESPASRLGLEAEDILLRIDGKPVMKPEEVEGALGGEEAAWMHRRVRILRDGEIKDLPEQE